MPGDPGRERGRDSGPGPAQPASSIATDNPSVAAPGDVCADGWGARQLARAIGMRHVLDAVPVLVDEWLGGDAA